MSPTFRALQVGSRNNMQLEMTNLMEMNDQMKEENTVTGTARTVDRRTPEDRITTIIIRIKIENTNRKSNHFTIHLSNQPEMDRLIRLTNHRNRTILRKRTIQSRTEQMLHLLNNQDHTTVVIITEGISAEAEVTIIEEGREVNLTHPTKLNRHA